MAADPTSGSARWLFHQCGPLTFNIARIGVSHTRSSRDGHNPDAAASAGRVQRGLKVPRRATMARMRRRIILGIVTVVVLVTLSPLLLNVAFRFYRPPLREGESYGLDVSSHQGTIDWTAVAKDGISAAYIKASEGGTWKDTHFADNWKAARAAGLRVGAYHFFTLCRDGQEQAENFLSMLDGVDAGPGEDVLGPVVDLELAGNCSERPAREVVIGRLEAFVTRVERQSGQKVMLYVIDSFESSYPLPPHLERARWERRLVLRPDGDWAWWQANAGARVKGVDGPVDLNVVKATP